MKYADIKRHLSPYGMYQRRKTTVNHAFAAAIAPCDDFSAENVEAAVRLLDQNPDAELTCVYCDNLAETWDHVFATVEDSVFSGAGHRVGNLLPCCKSCNSRKGNSKWEAFVLKREGPGPVRDERIARIRRYLERLFVRDSIPTELPEYRRLLDLRDQVLALMKEADGVAGVIRAKMKEASVRRVDAGYDVAAAVAHSHANERSSQGGLVAASREYLSP